MKAVDGMKIGDIGIEVFAEKYPLIYQKFQENDEALDSFIELVEFCGDPGGCYKTEILADFVSKIMEHDRNKGPFKYWCRDCFDYELAMIDPNHENHGHLFIPILSSYTQSEVRDFIKIFFPDVVFRGTCSLPSYRIVGRRYGFYFSFDRNDNSDDIRNSIIRMLP